MEPILEVQSVSKKYAIRTEGVQNTTLRDALARRTERVMSVFSNKERLHSHDFWALQDVSFSVKKGEALGIIGRNGSGKSTLLKIISNITLPTKGRVLLRSKVTSLLEVGTGFHPELSGRENIFLNATLLGMGGSAIKEKLPLIIEYSGIGEFIDVPVKKYSSGMFVRLAFSVAIHLEPEILILDEVLSLGDIEFQKKGFQTIQDLIQKKGVTVICVSHSIETIKKIVSRVILLNKGKLIADGNTEKVLSVYKDLTNSHSMI
ncbi:MAG: ABC transporter ATP-binding protein [Patescibacteria group bacterium]